MKTTTTQLDYGRQRGAQEEWGNSLQTSYFKGRDAFAHAMAVLISDAWQALPVGARFELRQSAADGDHGLCWYRCTEMDALPNWGARLPGRKDGYILIGEYVVPAPPRQDVLSAPAPIPGVSPQPNHFEV